MRPLSKREVEAGIIYRDEQIDVLAQDELPDLFPQAQQVGEVPHDFGEAEDCQPIQSGQ